MEPIVNTEIQHLILGMYYVYRKLQTLIGRGTLMYDVVYLQLKLTFMSRHG